LDAPLLFDDYEWVLLSLRGRGTGVPGVAVKAKVTQSWGMRWWLTVRRTTTLQPWDVLGRALVMQGRKK
jgi:hypothetical protein